LFTSDKYPLKTSSKDWKQDLAIKFGQWLDQLDDDPIEEASNSQQDQPPDLYAFYEPLCLLGSDVRKETRRSHGTFVRFGEALERFEQTMQAIADRQAQERAESSRLANHEQKAFLKPYAEMLERLTRLEKRLATPPETGLLSGRRKWNEAWNALHDGFVLLSEHFEMLLKQSGIERMESVGKTFDPARMKAVAVEQNQTVPPNTVMEELASGFLHKGEVLKFAEVKISTEKGVE